MPGDDFYPFSESSPAPGSGPNEPSSGYFRWLNRFFNSVTTGPVTEITKTHNGRFWIFPDGTAATPADPFNSNPFALNVVALGTDPETWEVTINDSTVQGSIETMSAKTSGSGDIWVELTIDDATGEITAPSLTSGSSAPASSTTKLVIPIGYWDYPGGGDKPTAGNYRYGPIYATSERLYYINPAEWAFNPN